MNVIMLNAVVCGVLYKNVNITPVYNKPKILLVYEIFGTFTLVDIYFIGIKYIISIVNVIHKINPW